MEETISLRELVQTLRKRMGLIVVITLLAVISSGIVSYFYITPIYQASSQMLVNQSKNEQQTPYSVGEVQTNLQLINTYNVIIKSPAILEVVINELDLNLTVGQLTEKINVQSEQNSQVVTITVQDPNPKVATNIANATVEVFQTEIKQIMNVDNVSILAKAEIGENPSPVKPNKPLNMAIALVVGLMSGVGIAFLIEYLDSTLKTEQDIEKVLELPVLGAITSINELLEDQAKFVKKTTDRGETLNV